MNNVKTNDRPTTQGISESVIVSIVRNSAHCPKGLKNIIRHQFSASTCTKILACSWG